MLNSTPTLGVSNQMINFNDSIELKCDYGGKEVIKKPICGYMEGMYVLMGDQLVCDGKCDDIN